MAPSASAGRRSSRILALGLVVLVLAASFLVFAGSARAVFGDLTVAPGQYTGSNLYVPGETMQITVRAGAGESYDIQVIHWLSFNQVDRLVYQTFDDVLIPTTGVRTLTWTIGSGVPDGIGYYVTAHDASWFENGNMGETYDVWPGVFPFSFGFEVRGYDFTVWTDRRAYLPGDTVTIRWAAQMIQDGSPAPSGAGEIQVFESNGTSLITPPQHAFNASQGSFPFVLRPSVAPSQAFSVFAWFNVSSSRTGFSVTGAFIGYLGLLVNVPQARYAPLDVVTVNIATKVTANPGNPSPSEEGQPGALLNITVLDLATGAEVTDFAATGLRTDARGDATYLFQLKATPTSSTFEVQVRADTSVASVTESDAFDIGERVTMSVRVSLDQVQYLSGTAATATAVLLREPPGTALYTWTVTDVSVFFQPVPLVVEVGGDANFTYAIPSDFEGSLRFTAEANDGAGNRAFGEAFTEVAYGFLAMSLDRSDYVAGDTITATFSLESTVITSPRYFYRVTDAASNVVASGNTTGRSFSYTVPDPASANYVFRVTASQNGREASRTLAISEAAGYSLTIDTDKPSYLPGETIRVHYVLRARGTTALPQQFFFSASILGTAGTSSVTTSAEGDLFVAVPGDANQGNLILVVSEGSTGASALETVAVGTTNPLWTTEVGGVPILAVILGILLAVALIAIVFLWRRASVGAARGVPPMRPTPPPAAPPTAVPAVPLGPMSIPCKHCGTTIDITTSKRPIEVMCPSCGETQLVT